MVGVCKRRGGTGGASVKGVGWGFDFREGWLLEGWGGAVLVVVGAVVAELRGGGSRKEI